jgi:hypothetical protein
MKVDCWEEDIAFFSYPQSRVRPVACLDVRRAKNDMFQAYVENLTSNVVDTPMTDRP